MASSNRPLLISALPRLEWAAANFGSSSMALRQQAMASSNWPLSCTAHSPGCCGPRPWPGRRRRPPETSATARPPPSAVGRVGIAQRHQQPEVPRPPTHRRLQQLPPPLDDDRLDVRPERRRTPAVAPGRPLVPRAPRSSPGPRRRSNPGPHPDTGRDPPAGARHAPRLASAPAPPRRRTRAGDPGPTRFAPAPATRTPAPPLRPPTPGRGRPRTAPGLPGSASPRPLRPGVCFPPRSSGTGRRRPGRGKGPGPPRAAPGGSPASSAPPSADRFRAASRATSALAASPARSASSHWSRSAATASALRPCRALSAAERRSSSICRRRSDSRRAPACTPCHQTTAPPPSTSNATVAASANWRGFRRTNFFSR